MLPPFLTLGRSILNRAKRTVQQYVFFVSPHVRTLEMLMQIPQNRGLLGFGDPPTQKLWQEHTWHFSYT